MLAVAKGKLTAIGGWWGGALKGSKSVGACFKRGRNVLFPNGINLRPQVRACVWKQEPTQSGVSRWTDQGSEQASGEGRPPCWVNDTALLLGGLLARLEVGWWGADPEFLSASLEEGWSS